MPLRGLAGLIFLALSGVLMGGQVRVIPLELKGEFADSASPGAIGFACAENKQLLASYFSENRLRFEARLVRPRFGLKACHIHYEQTRPGFRASPEDSRILELIGSIEPNGLLSGRALIGDSFDILKAVVAELPRAIPITVYVTDSLDRSYWDAAGRAHFPSAYEQMRFIPSIGEVTQPWTQDQFKSGEAEGEPKVILPRLLYEGRSEDGEAFRPLLDMLTSSKSIRSKIAWEGGDLLFVLSPKDPSKLVLIHGGTAKAYWGRDLTQQEYSYVLQVEMGADQAIDLSRVGPHVDYLTAFLPADRIALVAREERHNYAIAEAAAIELLKLFGKRVPVELKMLPEALRNAQAADNPDLSTIEQLIAIVRKKAPEVVPEVESDLVVIIEQYIEKRCPDDPDACFSGAGKRQMMAEAPELFRRASDVAAMLAFEQDLPGKLLSLIEGQFTGVATGRAAALNAKAAEIARLGYRVVRVPYLTSPRQYEKWSGVSYLNMLVFDNILFVPTAGLGKAEERIIAALGKKIGPGYQVRPIPARFSILKNGGVHCVSGALRGAQAARGPMPLSEED